MTMMMMMMMAMTRATSGVNGAVCPRDPTSHATTAKECHQDTINQQEGLDAPQPQKTH